MIGIHLLVKTESGLWPAYFNETAFFTKKCVVELTLSAAEGSLQCFLSGEGYFYKKMRSRINPERSRRVVVENV
tara:strand:+ start:146783 stop:147004 length:222 start_codon:yes stop_codon:yes gene_type:complete